MTASIQSYPTWSPLANGPDADDAWEAIFAIAHDLQTFYSPEQSIDASLGSGAAGIALFFSYLHLACPGRGHDEVARRYLDRAFDITASSPTTFALFGGFVGVAWAAALCEPLIAPTAELTDLDEIDDALLTIVKGSGIPHFDLISGLAGVSIYAVERLPRTTALQTVTALLDDFDRRTVLERGGVTWHTPASLLPEHQRSLSPEGHRDLGVAHGVAGTLGVLSLIHDCDMLRAKAHRLFDAGSKWLMQQRLPDNPNGVFPYSVDSVGKSNGGSRLAWCYGDLGIACILCSSAQTVPEANLGATAIELALRAAKRPFGASGVVDACLCHGAAGNSHLFHRLFRATGLEQLRDASLAWFHHVLLLRAAGVGVGGFSYIEKTGKPTASAGLLEGAAGIGLALLAVVTSNAPDWDRMFLVSRHQPRGSPIQST